MVSKVIDIHFKPGHKGPVLKNIDFLLFDILFLPVVVVDAQSAVFNTQGSPWRHEMSRYVHRKDLPIRIFEREKNRMNS
jgi:hypothetical protein